MFKWETEKERMMRFIKIPPKKKLEWLLGMQKFIWKTSSPRMRTLRQKLRQEF